MERPWPNGVRTWLGEVTLGLGVSDQRSQWTFFIVQLRWPVQPVGPARRTGDSLRIFQNLIVVAILAGVLALRVHITPHRLQRGDFILSDASAKEFVLSDLGVEEPTAGLLYDRHREGPKIRSHFEDILGV